MLCDNQLNIPVQLNSVNGLSCITKYCLGPHVIINAVIAKSFSRVSLSPCCPRKYSPFIGRTVHHCIHKITALYLILSQMNPMHSETALSLSPYWLRNGLEKGGILFQFRKNRRFLNFREFQNGLEPIEPPIKWSPLPLSGAKATRA